MGITLLLSIFNKLVHILLWLATVSSNFLLSYYFLLSVWTLSFSVSQPADLDAWVSSTDIYFLPFLPSLQFFCCIQMSCFHCALKQGCKCAATTISHNNTLGGIQLENYTSSVLLAGVILHANTHIHPSS